MHEQVFVYGGEMSVATVIADVSIADARAGAHTALGALDPRLRALAGRIAAPTLAIERVLDLIGPLTSVFPGGGPARGSVIGVGDSGLLASLCAGVSGAGGWVALVGAGVPGFGALAERGGLLERTVVVATPQPEHLAAVLGALVDAVDLTVLGADVAVGPVVARRLTSRARERGSVLAVSQDPVAGRRHGVRPWPDAPDVVLRVEERRFRGLGVGHGLLEAIEATVVVEGRRAAGRLTRHYVTLAESGRDWSLEPALEPMVQRVESPAEQPAETAPHAQVRQAS